MRLPNEWEADRAPCYGEVHYLTHSPCGWRSPRPIDVVLDESQARRVVYGHRCEGRKEEAIDEDQGDKQRSAWTDYHEATVISARFDEWPENQTLLYIATGLASEAGEVAGQMKKVVRDDDGEVTTERREAIIDELGDVLWYAARIAESVGATLETAAEANVTKVRRRLANGTLSGSGER